jgi:hypothetical protein
MTDRVHLSSPPRAQPRPRIHLLYTQIREEVARVCQSHPNLVGGQATDPPYVLKDRILIMSTFNYCRALRKYKCDPQPSRPPISPRSLFCVGTFRRSSMRTVACRSPVGRCVCLHPPFPWVAPIGTRPRAADGPRATGQDDYQPVLHQGLRARHQLLRGGCPAQAHLPRGGPRERTLARSRSSPRESRCPALAVSYRGSSLPNSFLFQCT